MGRKITLLTLLVLFSVIPQLSFAWDTPTFRSEATGWNSTTGNMTMGADNNHWSYELSATQTTYFRIYVPNDGNFQIYPKGGTKELAVGSSTTDVWANNTYTDWSFKLSSSAEYTTYNVHADFESGWKISVTGSKNGGTTKSDLTPITTPTSTAPGYYLVGNFFADNIDADIAGDGNEINYNRRYFKLYADKQKGQYSYIIPASLTAKAQILKVNADGTTVVYGPQSEYGLHGGKDNASAWPGTNTSISDKIGSSYWNMTTRNDGVSDDDGLYEFSIVEGEDGVPVTWTVKHDATTRVGYLLSTGVDATAQPIFNIRQNVDAGFNNVINEVIHLENGQSYYFVSNLLRDKDENLNKYKEWTGDKLAHDNKNSNGGILPTAVKLYLMGNGGNSFTSSNPYNEVSPNELPILSGVTGDYSIEYNPSKGFNTTQTEGFTSYIEKHLGMRGQIISLSATTSKQEDKIEAMSIVGDVLPSTVNDDTWNWASTDGDMMWNETERCYEITIHTTFNDGEKHFRFVANHNQNLTWYEDDVKARTPYDEAGEGPTCLPFDANEVNFTNGSDNTASTDVNIVFNRPAGTWTIRFYIDTEVGTNKKTYKYTINGEEVAPRLISFRDYADVVYKENTRIIEGIGDYKYFTSWSDNTVWTKPENIDMFIVTDVIAGTTEKGAEVKLQKLDLNYIPKETGLILAIKEPLSNTNQTVYERGTKSNPLSLNVLKVKVRMFSDQEVEPENKGMLTPAVDVVSTQPMNADGSCNFLFGAYKKSKVMTDESAEQNHFLLGFWLPKGTSNNYPNDALLTLTKEQIGNFHVGTTYDYNSASQAKRNIPAVLFSLEEISSTTSVDGIENHSTSVKTAIYNIAGQQVDSNYKGIVIVNGKKYIRK